MIVGSVESNFARRALPKNLIVVSKTVYIPGRIGEKGVQGIGYALIIKWNRIKSSGNLNKTNRHLLPRSATFELLYYVGRFFYAVKIIDRIGYNVAALNRARIVFFVSG